MIKSKYMLSSLEIEIPMNWLRPCILRLHGWKQTGPNEYDFSDVETRRLQISHKQAESLVGRFGLPCPGEDHRTVGVTMVANSHLRIDIAPYI